MLLTLVEQNKIATLTLPSRVSGRYSLGIVMVEGVNGSWLLRSGRKVHLDLAGNRSGTAALEEGGVYPLREVETGHKLLLFADPETDDRRVFSKFVVPPSFTVQVGRDAENDICYRLPYVSGRHARLEGRDGQVFVIDLGSANGTFVNGIRVDNREVFPGISFISTA